MYRRKGLDCWQALGWKAAQRARVMIDHESVQNGAKAALNRFRFGNDEAKQSLPLSRHEKMLGPPKKLLKSY